MVVALLVFGTAFGYLEAAVVSYLRMLHEPARQRFYPGREPGQLFPLLTLDQMRSSGSVQRQVLVNEIGREAATLMMLAALALAVARNAGQWAAAFVIAFGAWDLTFYLFLRLLLHWPASLLTWDILFLVPVPWVGPVLAPVLVSAAMIAGGAWQLRNEAEGQPILIGSWIWVGMIFGSVVIVGSFVADDRNIMAGGMPNPFHWSVFALGMGIAIASYLRAVYEARRPPVHGMAPIERAEAAG